MWLENWFEKFFSNQRVKNRISQSSTNIVSIDVSEGFGLQIFFKPQIGKMESKMMVFGRCGWKMVYKKIEKGFETP